LSSPFQLLLISVFLLIEFYHNLVSMMVVCRWGLCRIGAPNEAVLFICREIHRGPTEGEMLRGLVGARTRLNLSE